MTQTAQHTPGPWQVDHIPASGNPGNNRALFYSGAKDRPDFRVSFALDVSQAESEAIVRLLHAAPDLLAALQSFLRMVDPYSLDKEGREAHGKALRAIWNATPQRATNRPGDEAAVMHEETGIDYERCLIMCNMD